MIDYFELRRSVMEKEVVSKNFIEQIIEKDLAEGKYETICTRFPPEPNGYLHIGHAKSILLNYGLSQEYNGKFNLRFDDTNPTKEKIEFVESIQADVKWLGADWEDRLFFASNYFDQMYEAAIKLIKKGKAFVCDLTAEQIREYRGTLTEPGKNSPYRDRSVEENLDLFERMKNGEFEDGTKVLRAKIDMASPNINMRDPVIYRVAHMTHHNTGDKWCIYPMYDFAHPIEDAIEGVTHSICTLEFEDHRPLYDWVVRELEYQYPPKQIEFVGFKIASTVSSVPLVKLVERPGILVLAPRFNVHESGYTLGIFAVLLLTGHCQRETCDTCGGELTDFGIFCHESGYCEIVLDLFHCDCFLKLINQFYGA